MVLGIGPRARAGGETLTKAAKRKRGRRRGTRRVRSAQVLADTKWSSAKSERLTDRKEEPSLRRW